jgi:hypothetical protein
MADPASTAGLFMFSIGTIIQSSGWMTLGTPDRRNFSSAYV